MDAQLTRMFDALGLPAIMPEPEVTSAALARIRAKTLASVIASLINDNEPLLRAKYDGATVTVEHPDGTLRFTIAEDAQ